MRRAARTDRNHTAIVDAFRKLGCSVLSLAALGKGVPDLLVAGGNLMILAEVKDGTKPPSRRRLTDDQIAFRKAWKGTIYVVHDLDQVAEIVRMLRMDA